jgi:hypothetical protein
MSFREKSVYQMEIKLTMTEKLIVSNQYLLFLTFFFQIVDIHTK